MIENNRLNNFIDRLISKTKYNELRWLGLNVHPTFSKKNLWLTANAEASTGVLGETVVSDSSYFCEYDGGYIYLAVVRTVFVTALGQAGALALIVQPTKESIPGVLYKDGSTDAELSAKIKRLYNLVKSNRADIDNFVDRFLTD